MDQNNNIIDIQKLNNEIKNNNVGIPILKQEIKKGKKQILEINDDDDDDDDDGLVTLIYETETEEILSLIKGATEGNPIILEEEDEEDVVEVTKTIFKGECSNSKVRKRITVVEIDDCCANYPPLFICEICSDSIPVHDKFCIKGCRHFYCSVCVAKYVGSKVDDNVTQIVCPVSGCEGTLELENCRGILTKQVFDRWGDALCEGVILASQKFYCPFNDCSALLIDDGGDGLGGGVIRESECPNCRRLFCAQCKVPWHPDIDCAGFQKLSLNEREREDILLRNLAKSEKWSRCPSCQFYVERIDGCLFMHCRCGYNFCYSCGGHLTDHYCQVCKR